MRVHGVYCRAIDVDRQTTLDAEVWRVKRTLENEFHIVEKCEIQIREILSFKSLHWRPDYGRLTEIVSMSQDRL